PPDRDVARPARPPVPPAAHHRPGLRHGLPHVGLRASLEREGIDYPRLIDVALQRGARWSYGELVERQTEEVALLLNDPDHAVRNIEDLHVASDRVLTFEQFIGEVVPEHDDWEARLDFLPRERAALLDVQRADVEVQLRRGGNLHVLGRKR